MATKPNDRAAILLAHGSDLDVLTAVTAGKHGKLTLLLGDDQ
jgi:hypothetical protein